MPSKPGTTVIDPYMGNNKHADLVDPLQLRALLQRCTWRRVYVAGTTLHMCLLLAHSNPLVNWTHISHASSWYITRSTSQWGIYMPHICVRTWNNALQSTFSACGILLAILWPMYFGLGTGWKRGGKLEGPQRV